MKKRDIVDKLRAIEEELKQQGLRVKTEFAEVRAGMKAGAEQVQLGLSRQIAATDQLEAKLEGHITTTTEQVGKLVGIVNSVFDSLEDWKAKVDRDHASLAKRVAALEKKSA